MNNIPKDVKEATRKFERGSTGKRMAGPLIGAFVLTIMYFIILAACAADKPFFMYKSDWLTMSIIFVPVIMLLLCVVICVYKSQSDYIVVSPKGIEIKMHKFASGSAPDFIKWDEIADYALHEVYTGKGNNVPHLVIKLRNENSLRKYNVFGFDKRGEAIIECTSRYLEPTKFWYRLHTDLGLDFQITWREVLIFILSIPGGISLAFTIGIYEQTFIPYWWWMAIVGIAIVFAAMIQPKAVVRRPAHYIIFIILSAFVCHAFLWTNYHFASWDSPGETKRYEILRVSPYRSRGGKLRNFSATIKYNDNAKDVLFPISSINELRYSKGVEFDIHKGLFGFDVYKEIRLY